MKIKGRADDSFWYYSQLFNIPYSLVIDSNKNIDVNDSLQDKIIAIPGYLLQEYEIKEVDSIDTLVNMFQTNIVALKLLNDNKDLTSMKAHKKINVPIRITKPIVNGARKYSYQTMIEDLKMLEDLYPFMKKNTVGYSVQQKPIYEIVIGNGEKKVHMNGSFHANEWITSAILMQVLNAYLLSLTNQAMLADIATQQLYHCTSLSLVPMVNPDGVDLVVTGLPSDEKYRQFVLQLNNGNDDFSNWKANINGVDLNNQFPAKWELEKPRKPQHPAPRDYPGEQPLSEPEAIAMANLTTSNNFDRVIAFHTQCKEIYWGFDNKEPIYAEKIVNEFAKVSDYVPVQTLDSYAGYKDWFIYEWKKPGFTVELGEGINPLPIEQFADIYKDSVRIFLAGLYM